MSTLDYEPPHVGSALPQHDRFKGTRTGPISSAADIRAASKRVGMYQTSQAKSNLARVAAENLRKDLSLEQQEWLDGEVTKYKNARRPDARANVDPNVGGATEATDYAQMYSDILRGKDTQIAYPALYDAMKAELTDATNDVARRMEYTTSDWPMTQAFAGGMGAVLTDPKEQALIAGSLALGLATGGTSLATSGILAGADIIAGGTVTASYQESVVKMYRNLGLGDLYDWDTAKETVAMSLLVPGVIYGAGRGIGYIARKTSAQAATIANKITAAQNKYVDKSLPADISAVKDAAEHRAIMGTPPEASTEPAPAPGQRVRAAYQEIADGVNVDPNARGYAGAKGKPVPDLEIAQYSDGIINIRAAVDGGLAEQFYETPFIVGKVRKDMIEALAPQIEKEMAQSIDNVPAPTKEAMAQASQKRQLLKAEVTKLEKDLNDIRMARKRATDDPLRSKELGQQAAGLARKVEKVKETIQGTNLNATRAAKRKVLSDQLDAFRSTREVPVQYRPIVDAQVGVARREHALRAEHGVENTATQIARSDDAFKDMGALPDDRPSKLPDIEDPVARPPTLAEQDARAAKEAMDPDTVLYREDEDGNVTTTTVREDLKEAQDLELMDEALRVCGI